ncbi:MAG TPA: hypothetical protein VJ743_21190 [Albitalea sp.]|nr:hypothetical protein [Albitalea sp.]
MQTLSESEISQVNGGGLIICNSISSCISLGMNVYTLGAAAWSTLTNAISNGDTVNVEVDAMGNFTNWNISSRQTMSQ